MRTQTVNLNERDRLLLYFLWKWKVATTSGIWRALFKSIDMNSAHKRLLLLARSGFIRSTTDSTTRFHLWTLDRRGFQFLRRDLPELKEEGYLSENPAHDLVVMALQLGDTIDSKDPGLAHFSEQQLRRLPLEFYPAWVPSTELHRPDGYWRVMHENSPKTIALEVELSPKTTVRYEIVADFYASEPQVHRVLWLTRSKSACANLHGKLESAQSGRGAIHNFVSYPDFSKHCWNAQILYGPDQGKTISQTITDIEGTSQGQVPTMSLLDIRKAPHRTQTCRLFDPSIFPD